MTSCSLEDDMKGMNIFIHVMVSFLRVKLSDLNQFFIIVYVSFFLCNFEGGCRLLEVKINNPISKLKV